MNVLQSLSAAPPRATAALATLAAGTAVVSVVGAPGATGILGAALGLVMLAIAFIDARTFTIPDYLNATAFGLAALHAVVNADATPAEALASMGLRAASLAACLMAVRILYKTIRGREGIGFGDVKLAAVCGAWLDWTLMPVAVEMAVLPALGFVLFRRLALGVPVSASARLPFGTFFAPAIWACWWLASVVTP